MERFSVHLGHSIASSAYHVPPLTQERLGVSDFEDYGDEVLSLYHSIARSHNVRVCTHPVATRVASASIVLLRSNDRCGRSLRWTGHFRGGVVRAMEGAVLVAVFGRRFWCC